MSEYIPVEREGLYRELGLEELLDDTLPAEGPLVINDKHDSLGNDIQLVWDRDANDVHMVASKLDVKVPRDRALESLDDHIPVFASQLGWSALEGVLFEGQQQFVEDRQAA